MALLYIAFSVIYTHAEGDKGSPEAQEEPAMTDTAYAALTPDQKHLEQLRQHGAEVIGPDGNRTELNSFFADNAVSECIRLGCTAITYDLFLPGIEEPLMIAFWRDGHIDSGSVRSICDCLAAR